MKLLLSLTRRLLIFNEKRCLSLLSTNVIPTTTPTYSHANTNNYSRSLQMKRFYSKKKKKAGDTATGPLSSYSDEIDEIRDDGLPKDYKLKKLKLGSRRLDTVINRATGRSSAMIEKMVLGGKVLVNESVVTKKAYNVQKSDVLDVWNEPYEDNADLVLVDRIEIVNYTLTTAGYEIDVKYWKKFLVENWRSNSN